MMPIFDPYIYSMYFKHPEILYFLLLLLVPILVHLFQLRRFRKEYFTNVRILKQISIQTRRSSTLKKWLLLATRLLLLACLIFAFAQPSLHDKKTSTKQSDLYIVLDNSFSMQAKGKNGELLKRAVQDLLQNIPDAQTFSLITNTNNFWNTNIKSIQKDLLDVSYSATEFKIDNLLSNVITRDGNVSKNILVITDAIGNQKTQLNSVKNATINFVIPTAEQKDNVSIDSVYLSQILDNFYEISVKLTNYGNDKKAVPLALFNNKILIGKTIVNFTTDTITQKFTIPKDNFNGFVEITDGSLDYDNRYFFNVSKPQKTKVISIGETAKNNFLTRIYNATEFDYRNFELNALDYNQIEQQDAIVLNEMPQIPAALQMTLKNFVEKGGNLIFNPSDKMSIANANMFLSTFGGVQFLSVESTEKKITNISYNHPLFKGVFERKTDNFQYPNTKNSFVLSKSNPSILTYEDQNIFLTSIQKEQSSVYVFAAAINKINSNFQNSPLIVPVFYKMAQNKNLTSISTITIGQGEALFIDGNLSKDEIVTISNENEKFVPIQQILNNKVKLSFDNLPNTAGNFNVSKRNSFLKNISFNYSRTESDLQNTNSELLTELEIESSIESFFEKLQSLQTESQFWKWLLSLAILFVLLEILIQKFVQ